MKTLLIHTLPSPIKVVDFRRPTIPLGLAYLAAVLERSGHEVSVIDNYVERMDSKELKKSAFQMEHRLRGYLLIVFI